MQVLAWEFLLEQLEEEMTQQVTVFKAQDKLRPIGHDKIVFDMYNNRKKVKGVGTRLHGILILIGKICHLCGILPSSQVPLFDIGCIGGVLRLSTKMVSFIRLHRCIADSPCQVSSHLLRCFDFASIGGLLDDVILLFHLLNNCGLSIISVF